LITSAESLFPNKVTFIGTKGEDLITFGAGNKIQPTTAVLELSGNPSWTEGFLTHLSPQVLERWCTSPRTIEVLMNTYRSVQLPEEAMGLVPPETLQVRFQDPGHKIIQLSPRRVPPHKGEHYWSSTEISQGPDHLHKKRTPGVSSKWFL
jgi:hypothetical protein